MSMRRGERRLHLLWGDDLAMGDIRPCNTLLESLTNYKPVKALCMHFRNYMSCIYMTKHSEPKSKWILGKKKLQPSSKIFLPYILEKM